MPTVVEQLAEELRAKSAAAVKLFEDHKKDGKLVMDQAVMETVRKNEEELKDINVRLDVAREQARLEESAKNYQDKLEKTPANAMVHPPEPEQEERKAIKSLGDMFVESAEYKSFSKTPGAKFTVEVPFSMSALKTTMSTVAGFAPESVRTGVVMPFPTRRVTLEDFIPATNTNVDDVKFMEETTETNASAEKAESSAFDESAIVYTQRSNPIQSIGHILPITEQQLAIAEDIGTEINERMQEMLRLKTEVQLLSGSGTSPALKGFYNATGIGTQAKGADPTPSAIFKAMTKVRSVGFGEPSLVILHPNDWQDIRLITNSVGDYIWGSPAVAGVETIWGKPVLSTTAATENTGLTGDFPLFSKIYNKMAMRIQIGYINAQFASNEQTIKVDRRLALVVYRGSAFCAITGI